MRISLFIDFPLYTLEGCYKAIICDPSLFAHIGLMWVVTSGTNVPHPPTS